MIEDPPPEPGDGTRAGAPAPPGLPDDLADAFAEEALGAAPEERAEILASWSERHPQHAPALRRLLAQLDGAERLLADSWPDRTPAATTHVGGHLVIRQLGEGAFGIVYLCAQRTPVVRNVAVKVLRPGAGDEKTLRRFAAERQLLAQLNHPTITQVYDAGALPDGRPFFVMEYVEGSTFRRYCEDRALSCRERLALFVDLCRGVAHAHARGIVHRDLKPSNVLVVDTEQGPVPKIIDFGIAKALFASTDDAHADGPRTDTGRVIGTPGYMSPEQAAGQTDRIDARADVFALGVMLYEVLTGEMPWERGAAATETDPPRPSARVTTSTTARDATAVHQRRSLAAELRGDLDWITLKALARERDERYPSANALGADLERHLRGEPVTAGPPSRTYRLRKFVRRNSAAVAIVGLITAVSGAGIVAALVYGKAAADAELAAIARQEQTERDAEADRAAAAARQQEADRVVAEARRAAVARQQELRTLVDRLLARANDPAVREAPKGDVLRQALLQDVLSTSESLQRENGDDPMLRLSRCRALTALSHVYWLLGDTEHAAAAAQQAVSEAEWLHAREPENIGHRGCLGEALRREGAAVMQAGRRQAAHALFDAAVEHLAVCAAADPVQYVRSYASTLADMASLLEPHRGEESLQLLQAALDVLEPLREDHAALIAPEDVQICCAMANELVSTGRDRDVPQILDRAEQQLPLLTTDRLRWTYEVQKCRAKLATATRQHAAAVEWMQRAVAAAEKMHQEQPQRPMTLSVLASAQKHLGYAANYAGDFATSEAAFRRGIAHAEQLRERFPENPEHTWLLGDLLVEFATTLHDRFRRSTLDEAAACAARAAALRSALPAEAGEGWGADWTLRALQAQIEEARAGDDRDAHWAALEGLLANGAKPTGVRQLDTLLGACFGLAHWHHANGRPDRAATWLSRARRIVDANPAHTGKRAVEVGWLEARLAASRGDHAEAAAAADRVLRARDSWFGRRRAADCLHLAWRTVLAHPEAASPELAAGYRSRAAGLYGEVVATLREDVQQEPTDPWFVLPWGGSLVRAAELAAAGVDAAGVSAAGEAAAIDAATALAWLDEALPRLEAVRGETHADLWDENVVRDGRELLARLRGGDVPVRR